MPHAEFPPQRPPVQLLDAALGRRVVAATTSGAFRGGSNRRSRPERDEQELSRFGFGFLPSGGTAEPPGVRLRHGRIFETQIGTGHLRFGGVPLHRRERPSRPRHHRHVPATVLKEIEALFVQVLLLAREIGMLKMGTVALDGTKIHANASRHSALSYEHAGKIEAQLKAEVAELLVKAEAVDQADVPDGMSVPEELARRNVRLEKLAAARSTIESRAKERFEREQAEYQAKLAARAAKTEATGKKPGGKPPQPPVEGPLPTDQVNLTDDESRIMPVAGGGFDQCYNAQAVVAAGSLLVVATDVVQAANDKQQLEPMLTKVVALPDTLGKAQTLLADNGYFSAANVTACAEAGVVPLIAMGREAHHPSLDERFATAPPAPENPTPLEAMAHQLQTPGGKKLYALRKQVPEPVFGIIKSVLGFRQFLLRGIDRVRGEWSLVTMAWNMKRMFVLRPA